jgi:hypothetical protein
MRSVERAGPQLTVLRARFSRRYDSVEGDLGLLKLLEDLNDNVFQQFI